METLRVIKSIDWAELREQKEFLLNHGGDEAMGLAHLIDAIQDAAVQDNIADEKTVFNPED